MRTVLGNEKLFCVPDGSLVAHAKFVATFCAAAREYRAPVFTLHTRAKPMCFCPLTVIWLKCTFWHFPTRFGQANRVALPYCASLVQTQPTVYGAAPRSVKLSEPPLVA
jgi:hypothetical protein